MKITIISPATARVRTGQSALRFCAILGLVGLTVHCQSAANDAPPSTVSNADVGSDASVNGKCVSLIRDAIGAMNKVRNDQTPPGGIESLNKSDFNERLQAGKDAGKQVIKKGFLDEFVSKENFCAWVNTFESVGPMMNEARGADASYKIESYGQRDVYWQIADTVIAVVNESCAEQTPCAD